MESVRTEGWHRFEDGACFFVEIIKSPHGWGATVSNHGVVIHSAGGGGSVPSVEKAAESARKSVKSRCNSWGYG